MVTIGADIEKSASCLRVSEADDVAVVLSEARAGEIVRVHGQSITLTDDVPAFHKFALRLIEQGEPVRRFGEVIGKASQPIQPGQHVHSHNLSSTLGAPLNYDVQASAAAVTEAASPDSRTFAGYRRADGRVGTRNEIWVIPTVGCVARTSEQIARYGERVLDGRADAVFALPHPFGCSQLGDDLDDTRKILAALASHPNVGGVVLVALGCESNQVDELLKGVTLPQERIRVVRSQMVSDEQEEGEKAVDELLELTGTDVRTDCSVSELVIGLKCGGSDALSGLTANPLLGDVTDWVTGAGGRAVLTEIPEIFGAEHLLMARSPAEGMSSRIADLVNDFKDYFIRQGQPVNENPSPGNKAGGITTLEEKSLGAVQKAGKAPVTDVIRYAERVSERGLTLLEAPGNDAISCTALAAAGATVILFTTGRGTPLGFPVPTMKISSNTPLAERKSGWIDFNAGQVLETDNKQAIIDAFLDHIVATASGEQTCSEKKGERSIAIWKKGVTL